METYVIVALLKKPISEYQKILVDEIAKEFPSLTHTKEQGMDAHFTLKYPFETGNISAIENSVEKFAAEHYKRPIHIGGFERFEENAVFAEVVLSQEAKQVFDEFLKELREFEGLRWEKFEGEGLHFHMTVAQRCGGLGEDVIRFIKEKERQFDAFFDNITLLKLEGLMPSGVKKWVEYKSFELKS